MITFAIPQGKRGFNKNRNIIKNIQQLLADYNYFSDICTLLKKLSDL
ncbi:hypothetical protein CLV32_2290 [Pedobacter duraquae]|uniref:Uncharacterized protein n=1 Tax=Pedobacter duraquae TaxID=425511 RepID=A0A4R6IMI9_9SPHI|nr:hypothetical protein CLV32_2290 [Pedobacter duraquae]